MKRLGLIGFPLGHSFSKSYFESKFEKLGLRDHSYESFECPDLNAVKTILDDNSVSGLNITIPYKTAVIPFLTKMSEAAEHIGAVNCLVREQDGWTGHNTDAPAFKASLENLLAGEKPKALILGTGGASKAVAYALDQLGIEFKLVSRTKSEVARGYDELTVDLVRGFGLVVNCTPAGMHPNIDSTPPLASDALHEGLLVYDLVYNPEETLLMKMAREQGARTMGGLDMLHRQAELGWEIWNSDS
jgi:shikimate dehydrogenase